MNQDKWLQAKELFHDAQALLPNERDAFLDKACCGDSALREQVENLLGSYESGFMEEPALRNLVDVIRAESDFKDGQMIGRYRLNQLIGSGGMGEVFLADDTELNRPVAFKVLHAEVAEDKDRIRRFIQEARAASALNHPNILTIHEIGTFENSRFIVSEYVNGETLRERLNIRPPSMAESLEIAEQIAAALQAAHEAGIVHRDIKPENIMLRKDGLVKVLDFGLAKLSEPPALAGGPNAGATSLTTAPGIVMGTVAYMSPEQARGMETDARADIWSLGVVLYEMLSGKLPFPGDTTSDIIASILKTDAEPLDKSGTAIPPGFESICFKALAKNANQRFQTAQDLLNELRGEKKKMENILAPSSLGFISEQNTEIIRHRPTLSAEYIVQGVRSHKMATFASVLLVTFIGIGFSVYKFNGAPPAKPDVPMGSVIGPDTTEADLKMSRVPSSGRIIEIAISPDGKYVAYVTADGATKNSIRLLQLATSTDVEIVPAPSSEDFDDLSFSPDGNYLYYVLSAQKEHIYRVPTLGGSPTKIADNTNCGGTVSPDGKRFAFHRDGTRTASKDILLVANPDGSNERIVTKSLPEGVDAFSCGSVPTWSPDSKELVCRANYTEKNENFAKLFALNIDDGSLRQLSDMRWGNVGGAVYMPDGNLLIAAWEMGVERFGEAQLWLIAPNSEPKRITNDRNNYSQMSATRKGDMVVALQRSVRRDLWLLPNNDVGSASQITSSGEIAAGFAWMPGGRILYGSGITGTVDIWTMNADGSGRKQLTANQGINGHPASTADGKYVLFLSNRAENLYHIFRANADGSNVKQLTSGFRETRARPSADGKWVYYQTWKDEKGPSGISRISIDGGESTVVATAAPGETLTDLDISKDGRIAYEVTRRPVDENGRDMFGWKRMIKIISPKDGKVIKSFDLPTTAQGMTIRWTPDGSAIAYNDNRDESGDIWTIPVTGKPTPKRLTNFRTPMTKLLNFDWALDGKQLVVNRATTTNDAVLISAIK